MVQNLSDLKGIHLEFSLVILLHPSCDNHTFIILMFLHPIESSRNMDLQFLSFFKKREHSIESVWQVIQQHQAKWRMAESKSKVSK